MFRSLWTISTFGNGMFMLSFDIKHEVWLQLMYASYVFLQFSRVFKMCMRIEEYTKRL
jgi:hypothetical protein